MNIKNIHQRQLAKPAKEVAVLLAQLASNNDVLWPHERWPAMYFDKPIGVGAIGGHGPIQYFVKIFDPQNRIEFVFTAPKGFYGHHALVLIAKENDSCVLRHELAMQTNGSANFSWPLIILHLHNALIEDALDKASAWANNRPYVPRTFSTYVIFLRTLRAALATKKKT